MGTGLCLREALQAASVRKIGRGVFPVQSSAIGQGDRIGVGSYIVSILQQLAAETNVLLLMKMDFLFSAGPIRAISNVTD